MITTMSDPVPTDPIPVPEPIPHPQPIPEPTPDPGPIMAAPPQR